MSQILVEAESLKEILEQAEISCTVKNQQGSSLAGEVPFAEVFPGSMKRGRESFTDMPLISLFTAPSASTPWPAVGLRPPESKSFVGLTYHEPPLRRSGCLQRRG